MLDSEAAAFSVAMPDGVGERHRILNPMYRLTLVDASADPATAPAAEIGTGFKALTVQRRFCGDYFVQLDREGGHESIAGTGATRMEALTNALKILHPDKKPRRKHQ